MTYFNLSVLIDFPENLIPKSHREVDIIHRFIYVTIYKDVIILIF